jgi:uncharacterized membrane protein
MILAKFLHVLGFTIWVGGMYFAHVGLRPNAETILQAPQRLPFWESVLGRFFVGVWLSVALVLVSGLYMMAQIGRPPAHVSAMFILGVVMTLVFSYVFFSPYKRLREAVAVKDWDAGNAALAKLRLLTGINLRLGLLTVGVAMLGPLF